MAKPLNFQDVYKLPVVKGDFDKFSINTSPYKHYFEKSKVNL